MILEQFWAQQKTTVLLQISWSDSGLSSQILYYVQQKYAIVTQLQGKTFLFLI